MTHGAGGFSSGGGGGGFSGGGGGGFHMHHHSTHSSSEGGDEECGKCCCYLVILGINIASILLCIRKMSRYLRIALLWLYVATAVLTTGLVISISVLGTNKFQAAPTDMRKVEDHVNNAFCESLTLNSSDPFAAYTFDQEPVVDPDRTEEFNTSYSMTIFSKNYEYWGFFLLPGSTLHLNSSTSRFTTSSTTLFVIQGDSNLQTWLDGEGHCSGCYIYKHDSQTHVTYTMNSTEADNYFFVFFNQGLFDASSTAHFFIRRTLYDVTKATSNCTYVPGKSPCRFDVSLNPEQSVVFHSSRRARHQSIDMWSSCKARVWLYVIVFALIPIMVAGVVSVLFWKFCKDDRTGENQALVSDQGLEDVVSDQQLRKLKS